MGKRIVRCLAASVIVGVGCMTVAGAAAAAYPGTNGKVAYVESLPPLYDADQIFAIEPNGTGNTLLISGGGRNLDPSYSADGERIVFARAPSMTEAQIWVASHDGSGETQLTSDPTQIDNNPSFSPDGSRIAFQRDIAGDDQIWIMNADGSDQTQLTFPGADAHEGLEPTFAPDGRIAYSRNDGPGNFDEIFIMNANGTNNQRVTTGSATISDSTPDVAPDGNQIVFERNDSGNSDIVSISLLDSSLRPIVTGPEDEFGPVFSPDGTRIAFDREPQVDTHGDLLLADSTGLDQNVTILRGPTADIFSYDPTWQPLNPPACDVTGKAKQKSVKSVSVTVTCDENVTAVADGSGSAPKVPKGATASKKKKFTIPAVTEQVQQGTPTTVTLTIPKKGKKALKKATKAGKKGKATVTADLTDDLGQSSTEDFAVTFKAKKK